MLKKSIVGLSLYKLQDIVVGLGLQKFVAKQLIDWVYSKRITNLDQITNISKKNLELLSKQLCVGRTPYSKRVVSEDGTCKYLFQTDHGNIESVMIPEGDRSTICVSSQVGCKMNCQFCMTGKCGFAGNLTTGEILNQVMSIDESDSLTNIVFMGMGEPMDNLGELLPALEILTSEWGFGMSPKRITVSTSGLIDKTERFLKESDCHLAISLHNPIPEERAEIMPIERSNKLRDLISMLKGYDFSHQRRLSFEYIVFEGKNDSLLHAKELVGLLKGLDCRVNLIRFHKVEGLDFMSPTTEKIEQFRDYLSKRGITTTIRRSRGEDIDAACGQLKNKEEQCKKTL